MKRFRRPSLIRQLGLSDDVRTVKEIGAWLAFYALVLCGLLLTRPWKKRTRMK